MVLQHPFTDVHGCAAIFINAWCMCGCMHICMNNKQRLSNVLQLGKTTKGRH